MDCRERQSLSWSRTRRPFSVERQGWVTSGSFLNKVDVSAYPLAAEGFVASAKTAVPGHKRSYAIGIGITAEAIPSHVLRNARKRTGCLHVEAAAFKIIDFRTDAWKEDEEEEILKRYAGLNTFRKPNVLAAASRRCSRSVRTLCSWKPRCPQ